MKHALRSVPFQEPHLGKARTPLTEGLVKEASFSGDRGGRLSAVGKLHGDFEALLTVMLRSAHADSAEAARKEYFRSLDEQNAAIVNRCVAIFSDRPEQREKAVLALARHPRELEVVALESVYQDTRAMARSMLSS
jgi:hypothetical protein